MDQIHYSYFCRSSSDHFCQYHFEFSSPVSDDFFKVFLTVIGHAMLPAAMLFFFFFFFFLTDQIFVKLFLQMVNILKFAQLIVI